MSLRDGFAKCSANNRTIGGTGRLRGRRRGRGRDRGQVDTVSSLDDSVPGSSRGVSIKRGTILRRKTERSADDLNSYVVYSVQPDGTLVPSSQKQPQASRVPFDVSVEVTSEKCVESADDSIGSSPKDGVSPTTSPTTPSLKWNGKTLRVLSPSELQSAKAGRSRESSSRRRRRVTLAQLESLWELLNGNKSLATGFNKSAQARGDSKNMWMRAAGILNSHGDGAVKDWKGWCKYWNDYKSKMKSRLSSLRASNTRTGGGPADAKPLTDIEKKFVQLLGDDFGSGLTGARVEPFHYKQMETQPGTSSAVHHSLSPPLQAHIVEDHISSQSLLTNLDIPITYHSPPSLSSSEPNVPPAPSVMTNPHISPPNRPPSSPVASVAETHTASRLLRTPQRSPRRRRRRLRREVPLTQEMARRILIQQSERRLVNEEARLELLRTLVLEMREIKNILNSRHSASARDVL